MAEGQGATVKPLSGHRERTRRLPIGAEIMEGRIDFRVWAPDHNRVALVIEAPESQTVPLFAQDGGYFSATIPDPGESVLYRFRLDDDETPLPDPASRFQPEGPHGPSEVIDPGRFTWTDPDWRGPRLEGQIIYEMHVGTFTPEGTWLSATRQLPELVTAGVGTVEVMPIADFPGRFGWGYDGVAAHKLGLAVILDVVYNHLGPDGNNLPAFAQAYFTDRYQCEWGKALNFDGPDSLPVRQFFIANACYWVDEFHFDGFRLDATQQIFDQSKPGIIGEIAAAARRTAVGRDILVIGENEPQRTELLQPVEQGGAGLDALWNDDFHHSMRVALTGRSEAYYSDYRGTPQEILSAARHGYIYQGQRSRWQHNPRGTPSLGIPHARLIGYIQNHDQVANSAWGLRLGRMTSPGRHRAATTLLLLGPWTPMIFQGQEFDASTPFLYFADHKPEIAEQVAEGRKQFLSQFPTLAVDGVKRYLARPSDPETFLQSKLNPRERGSHFQFSRLFKNLVNLRKEDEVFRLQGELGIDGAVLSDRAFVLRFFGRDEDRLLIVNFGADLFFSPVPEPLLAPPRGQDWEVRFTSEEPKYGGGGIVQVQVEEGWRFPAEAAVVLASKPVGAHDG